MNVSNETENSDQMTSFLIDASKSNSEVTMNWQEKTGHIASSRYQALAMQIDSVPFIEKTLMDELLCIHCLTGKMKRSPILPSTLLHTHHLSSCMLTSPTERLRLSVDPSIPFLFWMTSLPSLQFSRSKQRMKLDLSCNV